MPGMSLAKPLQNSLTFVLQQRCRLGCPKKRTALPLLVGYSSRL